jgi:hypothetical protein
MALAEEAQADCAVCLRAAAVGTAGCAVVI